MNVTIYSYRFAEEIIQHTRHGSAWQEIFAVMSNAPLFIYPNKSDKNPRLYVVQQAINTYFDYVFTNNYNWEFHPLATRITNSKLKADFRKNYGALIIQAEVQFGNMGRWYSDIFKFQTAYSQSLINIGLSVVPTSRLAIITDSNVVNFERARRELPSAELSITLPILLIGLDYDESTGIVDLTECQFDGIKDVIKRDNLCRIVYGYLNNIPPAQIGPDSPVGINPYANVEDDEGED